MKRIQISLAAALLCSALLPAGTDAVGIVTSNGALLLDHARIPANATIFEGSLLETQRDLSQVEMRHGVRLRLAPHSRGRLFRNRFDLEEGAARAWRFTVQVIGLTVRSDGIASVSLDDGAVDIAAIEGKAHIFSAGGMEIAVLSAGRDLSLRVRDAVANPLSAMSGCVAKRDGGLLLTDDLTGLTVRLQGQSVNVDAGRRFAVTGVLVADPHGSMPLLRVMRAAELQRDCGTAGIAWTDVSSATIVIAAPRRGGTTESAVAIVATRESPSDSGASAESERNCLLHRGKTCNIPLPTGSANQSDQLSGSK